jgi:hypothetical protein
VRHGISDDVENCNAHLSPPAETSDEPFDQDGDDSEVVAHQGAIAVRGDEQGNIVIRQDDQFIDVGRAWVARVCSAMLHEAGLHCLSIIEVDRVELRDRDGNPITVKASQCAQLAADFETLDRVAEEERLDRIAERTPWERRSRAKPRDRTAAERQRRHRAKRDSEVDVTRDMRDGHGASVSGEAFR